ncbi:MAG: type IV pilus twitching motility protein PilT, partial [Acidobacteriota bacterium]
MAAFDKILEAMAARGAQSLELQSGEIPHFVLEGGTVPVLKAPLAEPQLLAYLKEMAGPAEQALLDTRSVCRFIYRGFLVQVAFPGGALIARVTPEEHAKAAPPPPAAAAPPPGPRPPSPSVHAAPAPAPPAPTAPAAASFATDPNRPIEALFVEMVGRGASDLHLTTGEPPILRISGEIVRMDHPAITPEQMAGLLLPICPEKNRKEYEETRDTDFAYQMEGLARFRCNLFRDRFGMGGVFRQIPTEIWSVEQLGLSKEVVDLCWLSKGFVVVTGPTGSGKSTTLASLVDYVNRNRTDHIVTIEDPVEFVHKNKRCLINQREVGTHTQSFKRALRAALREDPDIVLVGEMRDLETVAIAIETAETGHLVFGTLHTSTAASTVDRIIDQFPADRQSQIRVMLSETLKGVISQTLCKKVGGGRVAAYEILLVSSAIANLIREGKTFQIASLMQTQRAAGNVTMNDSLVDLVKRGLITPEEAYVKSSDKIGLKAVFERQ